MASRPWFVRHADGSEIRFVDKDGDGRFDAIRPDGTSLKTLFYSRTSAWEALQYDKNAVSHFATRQQRPAKGHKEKVMGMFDGIEKVTSTAGGKWVLPGDHLFKILALRQPPKLRSGDCFIGELEVVESNNPDYKVGDLVSYVRNITAQKEMALADVKAFLAAAAGIDEAKVDAEGAKAAVGEAQPFAGKLIRCYAFNKPQAKDATKSFTHCRWSHVEQ